MAGPVTRTFVQAIEWTIAHDIVQLARDRPRYIAFYKAEAVVGYLSLLFTFSWNVDGIMDNQIRCKTKSNRIFMLIKNDYLSLIEIVGLLAFDIDARAHIGFKIGDSPTFPENIGFSDTNAFYRIHNLFMSSFRANDFRLHFYQTTGRMYDPLTDLSDLVEYIEDSEQTPEVVADYVWSILTAHE
jgi:hypothetical protein